VAHFPAGLVKTRETNLISGWADPRRGPGLGSRSTPTNTGKIGRETRSSRPQKPTQPGGYRHFEVPEGGSLLRPPAPTFRMNLGEARRRGPEAPTGPEGLGHGPEPNSRHLRLQGLRSGAPAARSYPFSGAGRKSRRGVCFVQWRGTNAYAPTARANPKGVRRPGCARYRRSCFGQRRLPFEIEAQRRLSTKKTNESAGFLPRPLSSGRFRV